MLIRCIHGAQSKVLPNANQVSCHGSGSLVEAGHELVRIGSNDFDRIRTACWISPDSPFPQPNRFKQSSQTDSWTAPSH